jgi:glycosyltransferase involved in cell wall biosynthesis
LAKDEIQKLLSQSQIYLSTSTWEGLSFAILEAMERGLPLLLRRCVGNVDQVVDGKNGYGFSRLSEAIDRANQMADNPNQLAHMGKESRQRLEDLFSLHASSTAYNHLYKALLAS